MPDQYVGAPVRRVEDSRLITGAGRYVDDLRPAGLVYMALVRSPYPRARLVGVDVRAAQEAPGVVAVWTGEDTRQYTRRPINMRVPDMKVPPYQLLARDAVHVVGQPIAAVVATDPYAARDAAELVVVEYDPLPSIGDAEEALRPGAPLVHEELGTNVAFRLQHESGDVDGAFRSADHVVSLKVRHPRLAAFPLEPRALIASFEADELTLWLSCQAPSRVRSSMAAVLGIPENRIRVIAPDVGGGFGAKGPVYREEMIASLLSMRLRRPVKWVATRSEEFLTMTQGRGMLSEVSIAATVDGRVTGLKVRVIAEMGAEPSSNGITAPSRVAKLVQGAYDIRNIWTETVAVYTNAPSTGPYRGAGRPEAAFIIERAMDEVARAVGLDPVEVRRRNFIRPDQFPYRTATGVVYDSGDYGRALDKLLARAGYDALRREQEELRARGELMGIGLSTFIEPSGGANWESGQVRIEPSGQVVACTGSSPHGQGHETAFAQVVADRLGVRMEEVVVRHGDTAVSPPGVGTFGSRSAILGGSALYEASGRVVEKARRIAAYLLEAAPDDVELVGGRFRVVGAPDRSVGWAEVASAAYGGERLLPGEELGLEATVYFRAGQEAFGFGAHMAVVRIDPETGKVRLERFVGVDDCGRIINPLLVEGQVHGGLAQGIGQALLEQVVLDESGQVLTGSLLDYAVARADDLPEPVLDHTVTPSPLNPLGVKGVGEAGSVGSPPAVVNAVIDALWPLGVRHLDMPLTAEKVWRAIHGD